MCAPPGSSSPAPQPPSSPAKRSEREQATAGSRPARLWVKPPDGRICSGLAPSCSILPSRGFPSAFPSFKLLSENKFPLRKLSRQMGILEVLGPRKIACPRGLCFLPGWQGQSNNQAATKCLLRQQLQPVRDDDGTAFGI